MFSLFLCFYQCTCITNLKSFKFSCLPSLKNKYLIRLQHFYINLLMEINPFFPQKNYWFLMDYFNTIFHSYNIIIPQKTNKKQHAIEHRAAKTQRYRQLPALLSPGNVSGHLGYIRNLWNNFLNDISANNSTTTYLHSFMGQNASLMVNKTHTIS